MSIVKPKHILREASFSYPVDKLKCVLVILFDKNFNIIVIENKRGIDIPGGHVETFDLNIEATARRELMEEAQVTAGHLSVSGVLESDYNAPDDALTYMAIMTGFVTDIKDFSPNAEILSRHVMTQDKFLQHYTTAHTDLMRAMITASVKILKN